MKITAKRDRSFPAHFSENKDSLTENFQNGAADTSPDDATWTEIAKGASRVGRHRQTGSTLRPAVEAHATPAPAMGLPCAPADSILFFCMTFSSSSSNLSSSSAMAISKEEYNAVR